LSVVSLREISETPPSLPWTRNIRNISVNTR
jgi:hypothetical protein